MKRAYLFQSKTTLLVGKIVNSKASSALGPSPFSSLEPNVLNRLLDELARSSPKTLVLPNKINESYVTKSGGYNWMVYPYIGEASHLSENKHEFLQDEIIRTARRVTVELNSISAEIISELQRVGLGLDLSVFSEFAPFTSAFEQKIFSIDGLRVTYDLARKYPLESVNALAHYDLHSGNMVRDGDNIRVIDLETMQLGSICTDILRAAIWYNCTVDQIADGIQTLEACLARRVLSGEYAYGVGAWLAWFAVQPTESGESDINQTVRKLDGIGLDSVPVAKGCAF